MKNVMIVHLQSRQNAPSLSCLTAYLEAQIENSLELGWAAEDILILANFDYEFAGVRTRRIALHDRRLTTCKVFAAHALLAGALPGDEFWAHDLDAWQNVWFDCPHFAAVGICEYGTKNALQFNTGSMFYHPAARDIIAAASLLLRTNTTMAEEPALNHVLRAPAYRDRVTILNSTFNIGTIRLVERYVRSQPPVRVCHFHPDHPEAARIHLLGQNDLHVKTASERLQRVLSRHFDIPGAVVRENEGPGRASPTLPQSDPKTR